MISPMRGYPTVEKTARKFLADRNEIHAASPNVLFGLWISRTGFPKHVYSLGELADITIIYPNLLNGDISNNTDEFHPFHRLAENTYSATSPGRFQAIFLCGHDTPLFNDRFPTLEESRFMVYSALAAGAKGILYRGGIGSMDSISRRAGFSRLNLEVQSLKHLLSVSEPVEWVKSGNKSVAAKTLLCGTGKILLFLLDKDYLILIPRNETGIRIPAENFPTDQNYTTIKTIKNESSKEKISVGINIPEGFAVNNVKPVSRPNTDVEWMFKEGILTIQTSLKLSSEVLEISLSGE